MILTLWLFLIEGEKGSAGEKGSQGKQGQKGTPGTCDAQVVKKNPPLNTIFLLTEREVCREES